MPVRLRRLLLTTDAVGGVWRYTLDLARGLSARGIDSVVAVLGPAPNAKQSAEARDITGVTLVLTGEALDWTARDHHELSRATERLALIAALMGVQSVHLHAPALMGKAAWPAPVVVVAHSCVGTWWHAMRDGPPPLEFDWRVEATEAGLRRAATVVAPTQAHAASMREVYGPLEITVVLNGTAPPSLPSIPRQRAVLTAGRLWDEAKGVMVLDRAAAELDAPVRAAGAVDGPNGTSVAPLHLDLLGPLDPAGMAAAYAGASVFASMARYEPFGLAVLEAAQSGLRLVLADTPGFRELWDGTATFVTRPEDLVPALRTALDGGTDARARAARYPVEGMVSGTLAVHRALAGGPALPSRGRVSA